MSAEDRFCQTPGGGEICYRVYGNSHRDVVLLIAGLGLQLIYWPEEFVAALVERGVKVVVFDNRDSGRSFYSDTPVPSSWSHLLRAKTDGYTLSDMAADVIALMDSLKIQNAHLVGMSMGGMIAQVCAARYPNRTKSLTSIFSSTGSLKVGQPSLSGLCALLKNNSRDEKEFVENYVRTMRLIGARVDTNENRHKAYARAAWIRGGGERINDGISRQISAIINSGDRTRELSFVRCPTLVMHGDVDKVVAPSGGYATAAAIRGSRFICRIPDDWIVPSRHAYLLAVSVLRELLGSGSRR
ncbi:alpha/beta hydrolase [Tepidimonas taiwanensis]|uniref:Rhodomycin D methylesterase DauP n=1 Tax=Tepidimonas taiwanensis TaxID=307486 RepID=A0A554WX84_9BURK|nr:alpha/beta hydrolase [Tepidimonas taiwanensis]TSE28186.1 Rhodomycin D methylesterase DauP [Tepidimonas taiwanensis]UBQ06265.1 alpha/beta hydrolase [Tepidimonas taiwanensis]